MSKPVLKTTTVIMGKQVEKLDFCIGGYEVFRIDDDDLTLFFVDPDNSEVVGQIDFECGMSQGCGYISTIIGATF